MKWRFVVFRYQPDLMKDEWIPLGVVTESERGTEIGAVCFKSEEADGASDVASALLQDVPSILINEVEGVRGSLRHGQDFLEELRARNRWNFHFTSQSVEEVRVDNVSQASMELFCKHVLSKQKEAKQELSVAIKKRDMSAFAVAV